MLKLINKIKLILSLCSFIFLFNFIAFAKYNNLQFNNLLQYKINSEITGFNNILNKSIISDIEIEYKKYLADKKEKKYNKIIAKNIEKIIISGKKYIESDGVIYHIKNDKYAFILTKDYGILFIPRKYLISFIGLKKPIIVSVNKNALLNYIKIKNKKYLIVNNGKKYFLYDINMSSFIKNLPLYIGLFYQETYLKNKKLFETIGFIDRDNLLGISQIGPRLNSIFLTIDNNIFYVNIPVILNKKNVYLLNKDYLFNLNLLKNLSKKGNYIFYIFGKKILFYTNVNTSYFGNRNYFFGRFDFNNFAKEIYKLKNNDFEWFYQLIIGFKKYYSTNYVVNNINGTKKDIIDIVFNYMYNSYIYDPIIISYLKQFKKLKDNELFYILIDRNLFKKKVLDITNKIMEENSNNIYLDRVFYTRKGTCYGLSSIYSILLNLLFVRNKIAIIGQNDKSLLKHQVVYIKDIDLYTDIASAIEYKNKKYKLYKIDKNVVKVLDNNIYKYILSGRIK